jgi:hypothetical protein
MAGVIYSLCALTAFLCAWLLLQAYRRSRYRLLLWGGLCFCGLTLSNVLLVVDKMFMPLAVFPMWRLVIALTAMLVLLYGLIWECE